MSKMLQTDVQQTMVQVEATMLRRLREDPTDSLFFISQGDDSLGLGRIRRHAEIKTEFLSGSSRPVLGTAVRFMKRAQKRLLRWWIAPMMRQQSAFNLTLIDTIEEYGLQNERMSHQLKKANEQIDALSIEVERLKKGQAS